MDNRTTQDGSVGTDTSSSLCFGVPASTTNEGSLEDLNNRYQLKITQEGPGGTKCSTAEDNASSADYRITTQDSTGDTDESSSAQMVISGSNKKRKLSDSDHPNKKINIEVIEETEDIKVTEESCFMDLCSFAGGILQEKLKIFDDSIHEAKKTVIDAFRYEKGNKYEDIDFKDPENRIAYFTRHGPTSAGVARFKISKILDENKNIRNELQNFTTCIKILDLGTGHGCGIMGLCSSLNKYLKNKCINLTLVDHVKEWEPVYRVVEFSLKLKKFGEACDFFRNNYISTKYLVFDLSKSAKEHECYHTSLKKADVIFISRVLSIAEKNYQVIAENVVDGMKIGAILFFIDAMGYHGNPFYFEDLEEIASEENDDYEFEGTCEDDFEVSKTCKAKCFVYKKIKL